MGIIGGKSSIKMARLGGSFQDGYNNSIILEAMEEYKLASSAGKHAPMGFMASGGEFYDDGNSAHWADQKNPSFTI